MIKLDEEYYLESDSNQWTLNYKSEGPVNEKTGKPTIKTNIWYCANLKACLKRYYNEATKPAKNVIELGFKVKALEEVINNIKTK